MEFTDFDIRPGDYILINPDNINPNNEGGKIFMVLETIENGYIISPPSRPQQTLRFFPSSENEVLIPYREKWYITNTIVDDKVINWWNPVNESDYILVSWWGDDDRQLKVIPKGDIEMDYIELRKELIEYALLDETNDSLPFKRFTVSSDRRFYGWDKRLIIETRSLLGAIITYKDWLDVNKYDVSWRQEDKYMWDQMDPYFWSMQTFDSFEDLVENFINDYESTIVELPKSEKIGFLFSEQPQIKARR